MREKKNNGKFTFHPLLDNFLLYLSLNDVNLGMIKTIHYQANIMNYFKVTGKDPIFCLKLLDYVQPGSLIPGHNIDV